MYPIISQTDPSEIVLYAGIVILRQSTETIFPTPMLIVANEYQITCLSALNRIIFVWRESEYMQIN